MSGWVGAIVAASALVVGAGLGLLVRRTNGRVRQVTVDGHANGPARATGPARAASGDPTASEVDAAPVDPVLARLGVTAGTPVTLIQFSSAFCAPCRTTRALCAELAARTPGVRHLELDAESHLDAVRALDIWRTPTVLLVDARGVIRGRASGAPSRDQLRAAIAAMAEAA